MTRYLWKKKIAARKGGKNAAGNMDQADYYDDDHDEGEGEKGSKDKTKGKDGKPTASDQLKKKVLTNMWTVALAGSGIVVLVGMVLLGSSITARSSAELYMQYIDGYDQGEFLVVIAVLGGVSAMVGVYGAAVCHLSTNPKKFKRIRYLVLAYVGWGVGLVLLLLVSFYLTFSAVDSLEAVFKVGTKNLYLEDCLVIFLKKKLYAYIPFTLINPRFSFYA